MVTDMAGLAPFLPNNLSRSSIKLGPASDRAESEVRQIMRNGFGFDAVDSIRVIGNAGILSTNFLVEAGPRLLVLKARPAGCDVTRRLEREIALAERLLVRGQPVPQALAGKEGLHVVEAFGASWACFHHCAGNYFQGMGGELEAAARGYAALSSALNSEAMQPGDKSDEGALIVDLAELVRATPEPPSYDPAMASLYSSHRDDLMRLIDRAAAARSAIEKHWQVMHTDFHPLNVLMEDGRLTAILDFEDIKPYPVAAASGFAAYKLIRQALVGVPAGERLSEAHRMVDCWIGEWSRQMAGLALSVRLLGEGALYRVMGLLQLMFDAWLRKQDAKFNFDFPKQMGSLYEIGMIFDLDLQAGDS